MGLFDELKQAAGEVLSDAKDSVVDDAKDKVAEATGLDKVADAVSDVTDAKDSIGGAFGALRDGLDN